MSLTDMPTAAPGRKVVAGASGAGAGVVVAEFITWVLEECFTHGAALAAPPQHLIDFATPIVLGFLAAYFVPRSADEVGPPTRGQHVRRAVETKGALSASQDDGGSEASPQGS